MGDRAQIYIRYNRNKLLAVQVKYTFGADFIRQAFYYAEDAVLLLKKGEVPQIIDEDLLDIFFFYVNSGKTDLQNMTFLFNHSNQCGKCFIEIMPDYRIRYCFTDDG